jgi:hypothetical protein
MFNLNDAHVFEIIGNTNTYEYVPRPVARFSSSNKLRGGCQIGVIRRDLIGWLEDRLQQVQIIRNNPQWDCQDWVMEAIRWMKWNGVIAADIDTRESRIRAELVGEKERWEVADDTVEYRLFPTGI